MARERTGQDLEQRIRELETELSECRRLAEDLGRERDYYRTLVQNALDIVTVVKSDGTIVSETPSLERLFGYTTEELVGKNGFDFAHPDDLADLQQAFSEVLLKPGVVDRTECRFLHKDGSWRTLEGVYMSLLDDPAVGGVIISARDITERRLAEAAQRESEQRFRAIFEGSLDAILLVDPETGKILDANPAATELTGFPHGVLVGLRHSVLYPPGLLETAEKLFAEQILDRQAEAVELEVLCPDGTQKTVEILGQIIQTNGVPVLYTTFRDITERKHAERRWRESLETSRALLAAIADVALLVDVNGIILQANQAMSGRYGKRPDEVIGTCVFDLFSKEVAERRRAFLAQAVRTRRPVHYEDERDGRWVDHRVYPIPGLEGEVNTVAIIARDITERKRIETALRESEQMYRTFVRTSPHALVVLDPDGNIIDLSQQMVEASGFTHADELIGRSAFDFVVKGDHARAREDIRKTFAEGYTTDLEFTALRKDGGRYTASLNAVAMLDAQGNPKALIISMRDVTRQKRIIEELLKAQKLESVGILAGGIAHDFNNILTAILANLSMARMCGEPGDEVAGILADTESACLQAKRLTDQLLAFSKGGAPIRKATPLARSLRETAGFALSGSNLRCEYAIPEDLWLADIDEGQIYQVIQNLVINAKQAMPEGGVLRISAENRRLGAAEPLPLKPGRYVKVSVTDQGTGIPPKHLDKIFDPFFTTKHEGRGLGLAISYTIIKNHGGLIQVDSRVGIGTTFEIYLPAASQVAKGEEKEKPEPLRGQGRVLVIDDDELVLGSCGKVLRRLGYQVEMAQDCGAALLLYAQAAQIGKSFDAVIMDLTIPGGMGGREAIREMLKLDPRARVIVSSGYSHDPVMSSFREYGFAGVLAKPYRVEELDRVVRDAMKTDPCS